MATDTMVLDVAGWVNGDPVDLASLRGRVVVIEAFQMLCPGCVSHGLPQAQRIHRAFDRSEVVVIGLHTVFEHHDVMGPDALAVFASEYKLRFPIAIDRPIEGRSIPATMDRYGLQGTPSMLIVDKAGCLRHVIFGAADDVKVGADIGRLLEERLDTPAGATPGITSSGAEVADGVGGGECRADGSCSA